MLDFQGAPSLKLAAPNKSQPASKGKPSSSRLPQLFRCENVSFWESGYEFRDLILSYFFFKNPMPSMGRLYIYLHKKKNIMYHKNQPFMLGKYTIVPWIPWEWFQKTPHTYPKKVAAFIMDHRAAWRHPTTLGFPTKKSSFWGVKWGVKPTILRKHPFGWYPEILPSVNYWLNFSQFMGLGLYVG